MNDINVEKIMEEIRADIKARNLKEEDLGFQDVKGSITRLGTFDFQHLQEELNMANMYTYLNTNEAISGNCLKKLIKKVIRKCISFYVQPLIDKQNQFNFHCMHALEEINLFIKEQESNK
jgi:hypothetical protein